MADYVLAQLTRLVPAAATGTLAELPFTVCLYVTLWSWLLGLITDEFSWVDRFWSIAPVMYMFLYAYGAGFSDPRLNLLLALAAIWGARLTFNFWRKGGYKPGGEDYRWMELRKRITNPVAWHFFALFFIAIAQQLLLFALSGSAWWASLTRAPLGWMDYALSAVVLVLITGETIADEQSHKRQLLEAGRRPANNFITTGLFRFSRHPNFWCEQAIWWTFYGFSIAAGAPLINYAILGPIGLMGIFHGSTNFTEELSLKRYPEYAEYQRRTSRLLPWFPGK